MASVVQREDRVKKYSSFAVALVFALSTSGRALADGPPRATVVYPAPSAAAEDPSEPRTEAVQVHVDADAPAVLELHNRASRGWLPVCQAPCDVALPLSGAYRVVADGKRTSGAFYLDEAGSRSVRVGVETAPRTPLVWGVIGLGAGGALMAVGGLTLLYNEITGALSCRGGSEYESSPTCGPNDGVNAAGYVMVGVGAAAVVLGALSLLTAAPTRVTVSPGSAALSPQETWLRLPQWREDREHVAVPKVFGAPLLEGRF